ncbi:RNA polymerase sigma factor [Rhodopirellula sp. JC639]|uniref:RNA polymerase sigma factor n=1 Tax=Stieleria mannarensis TaxID=2755585 RepID=UPI001600AD00
MSPASPNPIEFTPTDKSLVVMIRDGDEEAAEALYDRYARRVFGLVRSKLGARLGAMTEPEDIVQSVFKSMFRGMQSGNYDAPPGTTLWNLLAVIAVRKLSNKASHYSAQRRDASRNVPLDAELDGVDDGMDLASAEFFQVCMQEALDLLRPLHRKILSLRIQGHSIDEIRDLTGRSRRTIERSLQKSRELLAESLLDEG